MKLVLFNLALLVFAFGYVECRLQWLTARGRARCGLGPAPEVASPIFIKLIDRDTGELKVLQIFFSNFEKLSFQVAQTMNWMKLTPAKILVPFNCAGQPATHWAVP